MVEARLSFAPLFTALTLGGLLFTQPADLFPQDWQRPTRMGRQNRFFGTRKPPIHGRDVWGRTIDIEKLPRVPMVLFFLNREAMKEGERWLQRLPRDLLFKENFLFFIIFDETEIFALGPRWNVLSAVRRRIGRVLDRYEKTLDPDERAAFKKLHHVWYIDRQARLRSFFGIRRDPFPVILLDEEWKICAYYDHFDLEVYLDLSRSIRDFEESRQPRPSMARARERPDGIIAEIPAALLERGEVPSMPRMPAPDTIGKGNAEVSYYEGPLEKPDQGDSQLLETPSQDVAERIPTEPPNRGVDELPGGTEILDQEAPEESEIQRQPSEVIEEDEMGTEF